MTVWIAAGVEQGKRVVTLTPEHATAILIGGSLFVLWLIWLRRDSFWKPRRRRVAKPVEEPKELPEDPLPEPDWIKLQNLASKVVGTTIQSLPAELRSTAEKTPCLFHRWSEEVEGTEILGSYSGFEAGQMQDGSGRITLFLGDIYLFCEEEDLDFEEEVRKTWLHEFGHHLGWDEGDLEERGLG